MPVSDTTQNEMETLPDEVGSSINEMEADFAEQFRQELEEQAPSDDEVEELLKQHQHHLVRRTTSRHTKKRSVGKDDLELLKVEGTTEVPDMYCFTCGEWVGLSGVDLRGTPRSRGDAFYLDGEPEAVEDARAVVLIGLRRLAAHVADEVPHVETSADAVEFIDGVQERHAGFIESADGDTPDDKTPNDASD